MGWRWGTGWCSRCSDLRAGVLIQLHTTLLSRWLQRWGRKASSGLSSRLVAIPLRPEMGTWKQEWPFERAEASRTVALRSNSFASSASVGCLWSDIGFWSQPLRILGIVLKANWRWLPARYPSQVGSSPLLVRKWTKWGQIRSKPRQARRHQWWSQI